MIETRTTKTPESDELMPPITQYEDPTELEGYIAVLSHPDSGTTGNVMARIETVTKSDTHKSNNEIILRLRNVLTGAKLTTHPERYPPTLQWPANGATYRVFALEHLNGRNEWVVTTPWCDTPHSARGYHGYTGHESLRMKYKQATYTDSSFSAANETVEITEGTCTVPSYDTSNSTE